MAARHQNRANQEGVDTDSNGQGEPELAQRAERAEQKRREATRGDGRRRRDQAAGPANRVDKRLSERPAT